MTKIPKPSLIKSKKYLRNKADKLVGAKCRSLGKCEFCGEKKTLQWSHFISRAIIKLRYDPRNYACLCYSCHYLKGHMHPKWFTDQWEKLRGRGITLKLEQESNQLEPITTDFYKQVISSLGGAK